MRNVQSSLNGQGLSLWLLPAHSPGEQWPLQDASSRQTPPSQFLKGQLDGNVSCHSLDELPWHVSPGFPPACPLLKGCPYPHSLSGLVLEILNLNLKLVSNTAFVCVCAQQPNPSLVKHTLWTKRWWAFGLGSAPFCQLKHPSSAEVQIYANTRSSRSGPWAGC